VLAVTKARDFDDALKLANRSEYGLTGRSILATGKRSSREGALFTGQSLFQRK